MADIDEQTAEACADVMYDAKPGSVAAWVWGEPDGRVHLAVKAPAEAVDAALADARAALERVPLAQRTWRSGAAPSDAAEPGSAQAFARRFAQERFLAQAVMRVGAPVFGEAELPTRRVPQAGEDYLFEAVYLPRPTCALTSCEPVDVALPQAAPVEEADVDEWLASMAEELGADSIDDAWVAANMPDLGSLAGLRERVRAKLAQDVASACDAFARDACADALALRVADEPDARLVEAHAARVTRDDLDELAASGISLRDYLAQVGIDEEAWCRRQHERAQEELRRELALDALAAQLDLGVTEADIARAVRTEGSAAQRERLDWYLETGQVQRLCEHALRLLAADWLVAHV